jgi:hypothetical protein
MEETEGTGENYQPVASHWETLSHNVVHLALIEVRTHMGHVYHIIKNSWHDLVAHT